ncbi:S41 family peptidase [Chloroflexota bacterium]
MLKEIKYRTVVLLLIVSLTLSFSAGCALGNKASTSNTGLDTINEVWEIIFRDYVEKDRLDASTLSEGAIKGMVKALDDPYTSYFNTEIYKLAMSNLEGKFEGIGAYVGVEEGQIRIITPIPNLPAAKAGIKDGDVILEIDGNSTSDISLEEAVLRIRGPIGTMVKLLILHQGETEPEEIEVVRAEIKMPSVQFDMREDTAYIHISQFSMRTNEELSTVLDVINWEETNGIVLDLRSNPGGLLEAVVDVAGHFLKEGVVVHVVDNKGMQASLSVKPTETVTHLPLVVLTDNHTASGGEVLAGALQDYGRAIIIGTKTYGKGSVNTFHRLRNGSGLYITTARWLTPNGHLIEGKGIEPDRELTLEGEDTIEWAIEEYLKGDKKQT